ncbi:MAG: DEAD/DEAH box helicase [Ferrovibrio sp.]|uniref:DEAD/DEAH box helicase n=1 Tax=Ferrovibrio sp. TaxID=1917215 RepID=UPI00260BE85E|nr:DEAD/DEAH box helicase [Ferrovibrio sp.]MCW0232422.1 DEAD/DEAH box helicase [Ferrovibrio sp.]
MTSFNDLGLNQALLTAITAGKYTQPTPIQAQAIPPVLQGRDLLGIAQTGTGKTAAFALPILHRLAAGNRRPAPKTCRALILSPTRELASQIAEKFRSYGHDSKLSVATVFGGVGMNPQVQALARGVDVLVATPGRLMDHMQQGTLRLDAVETVVLDEADQMLDLGFVHAIKRISQALPKQRQSLFFSATMPQNIAQLAAGFLKDPVRVEVTPAATTVERIDQQVIFIEAERKRALLLEIMANPDITRALVFTRTKHGADRVARHLGTGNVPAAAIHGNKSQSQRERALADFKAGRIRVLVATDIAARGIDVTGVSHVVNFELPNVPESYVHRIGRTARAGKDGMAISLCAQDERAYLRDIEKVTRQRIPATDRRGDEKLAAATAAEPRHENRPQQPRPHGQNRNNPRGNGQRHGGPRSEGSRSDGQRPQQRQGQRSGQQAKATTH